MPTCPHCKDSSDRPGDGAVALEVAKRALEAAIRAESSANRASDCIDRLDTIVNGGVDPTRGLLFRYEQDATERRKAEDNRKWWMRTTATAAIGALVLSIKQAFANH